MFPLGTLRRDAEIMPRSFFKRPTNKRALMWGSIVVLGLGYQLQLFACNGGFGEPLAAQPTFAEQYDFFTNYGNYMPRKHCLQTAEGSSDWTWIWALIGLNLVVASGYLRIFVFWRQCYLSEEPCDRDGKLMDLAWMFAICATCGYVMSTLIFFWPAYRLLALLMVGLAFFTWRFAIDLEPFRKSFSAHRLQRQLNAALASEKEELESINAELLAAHQELAGRTQELQKTNKDLDQFVYAASHDLRAPLRAIGSLAQFVIEDLDETLPPESRADLNKLQDRAKRMDRMLTGLLNYSRMQRLTFASETFTVRELAEEAQAVLGVPPGFQVELPHSDIEITSPRSPLEQVVRNLIDNAIKHHEGESGVISVNAEMSAESDEMVQFTVSDDGPGIDEQHRNTIFELFRTLRRRDEVDSSGMGLALVKRVVESHGGEVYVESESGKGSTFYFTWPLVYVSESETASGGEAKHLEELVHV